MYGGTKMEKNQYSFKGRVTKVEKYKVQENVLIQGVKAEKQSYYDSSSEYSGSNGSYVKHGKYHGMRLDMHFSLYDTDKIFYEYNGKNIESRSILLWTSMILLKISGMYKDCLLKNTKNSRLMKVKKYYCSL